MAAEFHHVPVMLEQVLDALDPQDGQVLVDCTLGGGGHTRAILERANCRVVGIDRDPAALAAAQEAAGDCADRLVPVRGSFGDVMQVLRSLDVDQVDFGGKLADHECGKIAPGGGGQASFGEHLQLVGERRADRHR